MSDTPHNHSRSGDKRRRLTVDDNVIYLNFGRYRDTEADTGGQENSVANRRSRQSQRAVPATSANRQSAGKRRSSSRRPRGRDDRSAHPWPASVIMRQLDDNTEAGRKKRGRDYFRQASILRVDIEDWQVVAQVMGSQPEPFTIHAYVPHDPDAVDHAIKYLADDDQAYDRFVQLQEDRRLESMLFPFDDALWSCSCPDLDPWCKHIYAVGLYLQDQFTTDPFSILRVATTTGADISRRVHQAQGYPETGHGTSSSTPDLPSSDAFGQNNATTRRGWDAGGGNLSAYGVDGQQTDPETFWGVPTNYPDPPDVKKASALEDHDQQALMKVLSWVSYGAVGQLSARSDLEDAYHHLMTAPPEMAHPDEQQEHADTTPDDEG